MVQHTKLRRRGSLRGCSLLSGKEVGGMTSTHLNHSAYTMDVCFVSIHEGGDSGADANILSVANTQTSPLHAQGPGQDHMGKAGWEVAGL
jgi:hypothetical protein